MHTHWYGTFSLPLESSGFWQAGSYQLWLQRSAQEWRVASLQGADSLESTLVVDVPSDRPEPPLGASLARYGFQQTPEAVTVMPALADRPVVVCPEEPLRLPPEEQTTLFISTPAWIQVFFGDSGVALIDEPTHRPKDTWFGPSTIRGEMCYATKTAARMNLENIPFRPHRVISVIEIRNRAATTLMVQKIKIPVIHQSVYASKDGNLWTETVTLDNQEDETLPAVRLGKGPPVEAPDATLLQGPRVAMDAGLLTRAFGGFMR